MSNLERQAATQYVRDFSSGDAGTELPPQSRIAGNAPASSPGWSEHASFRLSVDDLRAALAVVGVVHDDRIELRFADGFLLVRRYANEFTCQVAVGLTGGHSEPRSFVMWDEELAMLDGIQGELRIDVYGSGGVLEVVFRGIREDLTEACVEIERDRIWDDDFSPQASKMLPGTLLAEALRVIQPFVRKRRCDAWDRSERTSSAKMTEFGLGCNSLNNEYVYFDAAALGKSPWAVPVEVLPKLRKLAHHFRSFGISVDGGSTCVSDGIGSFIAWRTPDDIGTKFRYHSLKLDQFVARVSAKDIAHLLKNVEARVSGADTVVTLRVPKDNERIWLEKVVDGQIVRSPAAPVEIGRNALQFDIVAQFSFDSLRKMFTGTKAASIELRLYHAKMEYGREIWLLRSREVYSLAKEKKVSKTNIESLQCAVTRFTPSIVPKRAIQLA